MWKQLDENGFIKKGKHEGYYSVNEESFVPIKDLVEIQNEDGTKRYVTAMGEQVAHI